MKKTLAALAFLLCALIAQAAPRAHLHPQIRVARGLRAQVGGHSVALSWVLSADDTTAGCAAPNTCSQTVYRALGACSATPSFTSIATPTSSTAAFTDTSVVPGTYCYAVSFTQNGLESVKDTASVVLLPSAPSGLAGLPH